jgi:hypothetical protein
VSMAGRWFSTGTLVSYTNKTFRRDITEIHVLLKVNITLNARHFGTGAIRHQDISAPRQFGTCVFFFDFTYKTSNRLDSDVLISVF